MAYFKKSASKKNLLNLGKTKNSGIEGIAYNKNNGHIFVVKEKHAGLLFEFDANLKEVFKTKLKFAKDYSGLFYDAIEEHLWILSDENSSLFECNPKGKVLRKYKIKISNPEGVSIDFANNKVYIVSDSEEKLYVFKIKTAD